MAGSWNAARHAISSPRPQTTTPRPCWRRFPAANRYNKKESAMRIAIAGFMQETNSFVPFTTTVKTFEEQYLHRGDEILTAFGSARLEIPGALDAFKEVGATPVPLLATMAMASGTVERKSFDIIMGEIEQ